MSVTVANLRAFRSTSKQPFPHLSRLDTKVWKRFLESGAANFLRLSYDVKVGKASAPNADTEGVLIEMWESLTKKRIDVLAETAGALWVVEVKGIANMSALGQVIVYERLVQEELKPLKRTRRVVVCDEIDADVEPSYLANHVTVYVVGPAAHEQGREFLELRAP